MFCDATTFHIVAVGRTDGGVPSSANAWPSFIRSWVSWAGYPVILACDRGLHNYGAFSKGLAMNCVYQRVAGLEAAEQIGRGERHGGIFKTNMSALVNAHQVTGKKQMKMAAAVCVSAKTEMCRKVAYPPHNGCSESIPEALLAYWKMKNWDNLEH